MHWGNRDRDWGIFPCTFQVVYVDGYFRVSRCVFSNNRLIRRSVFSKLGHEYVHILLMVLRCSFLNIFTFSLQIFFIFCFILYYLIRQQYRKLCICCFRNSSLNVQWGIWGIRCDCLSSRVCAKIFMNFVTWNIRPPHYLHFTMKATAFQIRPMNLNLNIFIKD